MGITASTARDSNCLLASDPSASKGETVLTKIVTYNAINENVVFIMTPGVFLQTVNPTECPNRVPPNSDGESNNSSTSDLSVFRIDAIFSKYFTFQ